MEAKLSLVVPLDRQMRDNIRNKVEEYFSLNKTVPPVSYHSLTDFADILLKEYNWSHSFKAFVMVCCGNAVWRSVVGSVPYNRRMLLLPQCLKNSHLCKGKQDELGLLCSDCGNCNISGFLNEAESLGYITIVAEGTTIATKLVETGKVDAIIGVGCMEVLQKVFAAVNKYSLPAIGVPLLSCGCIDTVADAEWIREEIRHMDKQSGFELLNLNNLSDKTAVLFNEAQIDKLLQLPDVQTNQMIKEILLAGGKRIRPLLTVLSYESFCPQPDKTVLEHLAMSIECFHKASLVHDDIEDDDATRYGKETLHTKYGIPVAINVGDLLIGEGYRLIAECNLPPLAIRNCLKVVSEGHRTLSLGQGAELMARRLNCTPSFGEMITIFENKTSAAFKVALLLGAVAGEADEETIGLLNQFSSALGIAYQLKDDLEDFKSEGSKSFENPSVLIAYLSQVANNEPLLLEAMLGNAELLQGFMDKYHVKVRITEMLQEYLQKIESILGKINNIRLKLALHEIVGKTFRDYI